MICTIPYYLFIPFFLCWGSFLNVLAYRLIKNQSIITPRSSCPCCNTVIAWYDNIPVVSWLLLHGKCRTCKKPISLLYPCIEILTTALLTLLYLHVPPHYFFAYFILFSALIVTIRSDIETMLISRFATLLIVPFGFACSFYGLLPLTLPFSIMGAAFGYLFLFSINSIFKYLRNIDGIGEGDFDLLLLIGSFTGIVGCWMSITIGSIVGSAYGALSILYSYYHNKNSNNPGDTKIPFGPFLALGAILFVLFQEYFFCYLNIT